MIRKYYIELIYTIVFITLSVILNLQFIDGSNINHPIAGHDEYIAVKEVYSILEPASPKHFFMAVISGNALYYGRIMFYVDALFACIPYKIWGISGMVFSIRMLHAILILVSLLLLGRTFLSNTWQRIIFLIASTSLYYTLYFVMMPKPEPYQLLFLALFLKGFKKSEWKFTPHFIWLGIAYGLKFNALLILPPVFLIPLFPYAKMQFTTNILPGVKALFFMLTGIVIAIPCLLLSPLRPIFLKTYLHETFGGTEKLYDNSAVSFLDWFNGGFGSTYLGLDFLAWVFMALVFYGLYHSFNNFRKHNDAAALILIICGLILNTIIMIKTKRIWPHYLWTGYLLMLLGILNVLGREIVNTRGKIAGALLILICSSSFFFFFKRELPVYTGLSERSEAVYNHTMSLKAIDYVKTKFRGKRIATDGTVLYPFADFVSVDIYHPFEGRTPDRTETPFYWYVDFPEKIWGDSNEAILFYRRHPERMLRENPNVYVGRHRELYDLYLKKVNSEFARDTAFGELIVYRKR